MSIAAAISNAMSGLGATARGTETVAGNIANVMTPGYARRQVTLSANTLGGGVRIDGIARIVNATLVSEVRLAASSIGEGATRTVFHQRMEAVVGLPGGATSLSSALTNLQTALSAAATRPDDELRLAQVVSAADLLGRRLNDASDAVQSARSTAQRAIQSEVAELNTSLERVATLNTRIAILDSDGRDATPLMDERQRLIDRIAPIVPIQEVTREQGKVALFTIEGAVLLDGSLPARLDFAGADHVAAGQLVGAPLQLLTLNGTALTAGQMRLFSGGSLSANFQIRDVLAPQMQSELDDLAFDLHQRLADPLVDPTLTPAGTGLFTDAGARADAAGTVGLAGRITLNTAVDPSQGGQLWRLRSGLEALPGGPVGQSDILLAFAQALDSSQPAPAGSGFTGTEGLATRFGVIESRVASRRVDAQSELANRNARQSTVMSSLMSDGVDSDAEMQRLLHYEQSYAANARVLMAVDDMINQILRM
ncbi:flagellar hook-associated protein FlgK [Paracoccus nototheniae]|uniref:Flagellar hook-associated protein 1 n=1 Tax=Paracoccus nototheniae TaxID=2489002 RepID=A0ABW4DWG3_9RHOB|nr:flagellar hook-associated protein FlgK [Paracoccus nototheniae]